MSSSGPWASFGPRLPSSPSSYVCCTQPSQSAGRKPSPARGCGRQVEVAHSHGLRNRAIGRASRCSEKRHLAPELQPDPALVSKFTRDGCHLAWRESGDGRDDHVTGWSRFRGIEAAALWEHGSTVQQRPAAQTRGLGRGRALRIHRGHPGELGNVRRRALQEILLTQYIRRVAFPLLRQKQF